MKEKIIKYLANNQLTEFGRKGDRDEYKGFWINDDDCPLFTYDILFKDLNIPVSELKEIMLEMRNIGLIKLVPAVDYDYDLNGSGWLITEKGMIYAVDNNLIKII